MDAVSIAITLAGLYGASKVFGVTLGGTPSGLPPTAPVPLGQSSSASAPPIAGHVVPTPPETSRADSFLGFPGAGLAPVTRFMPWPDTMGIWRDGDGNPFQFSICGVPTGQPGYMSLEFRSYLDRNVRCEDGKPISTHVPKGAGAGFDASGMLSTGVTVATTAATVATAAGVDVAAGIAAGAGAALAALGPMPGDASPSRRWRTSTTHMLGVVSPATGRRLALHVVEVGLAARWIATAIEVDDAAAALVDRSPLAGVAAMYDDHGHAVLGDYTTIEEARAACEAFAAEWLASSRMVACPCPELGAVAP